ncbi:MAG: CBS domain-containing protein [Pseudomonadales bacterium]|nr:CBS domain-containing protein [Pseudomonadales bacterium]
MPQTQEKSWFVKLGEVFGQAPSDRKALMDMLRDATDRQLLDGEALNIMFGAMQVADMQARDVMIPRSQLVTVPFDGSLQLILPIIIESQHSRFPVVGEDLDDLRGIIHAKDLLPLLLENVSSTFDIKDCIRPAKVVPGSMRLNVLLQEFRNTRNHMALVVDEYGHIVGAVTIEDVLEQIVGEIEDEHDVNDDSFIKRLDDGTYTVKATTMIEDFNEYFDANFPSDEFDTVGGSLLKRFGRLPDRGESTSIDGYEFIVLNADSRRVRLLKMVPPATIENDPGEGAERKADGPV